MVLVVLIILNMCVLVFFIVSVVWSVWVRGCFYGLWIGPGFIFDYCS